MANSYTETSNTPSEITNVLTESSIHDESGENSENFHNQSGHVEAINEDELENETHEQVCDFAADDGSDKMNNEAIAAEFFEEYVSNEGDQHTEPSQGPNDQHSVRKSSRSRRPRQISPESGERSNVTKRPRTSALPKTVRAKKKMDAPFKCDLCGSQHITDPSRRGNRPKTSAHAPSPRHKLDPESGRMLTLCNACGLSFNRPKAPRHRAVCDQEAKRSYLEEASQFAASLAEGLEDPDASRLYCPQYKTSACACLQKYILAEGNINESRQRAQQLLSLLKQSQILSKQKCYNNEETENLSVERKGKRGKAIGLGNGQRKSKEFETFVLEQRKYLREDLKLCEQATQRVLCYSNNFLHKKLKTDPTKPLRVKRQKGQAVLGKLKSIDELAKETCCVDKCVSMALTHSKLLQQWRERSATGQAEARRVLAEMLTPSGGARSNCYKFISWVTGCSHSTIGRVNDQMKKTGGDREPPVHGLINWWKDHPKPKKVKPKPVPHNPATHGVQIHHFANAQLQALQQLGILQPANVAIQGTLLSGQNNPQVITINPSLGLNIPTSTQTQGSNRQVVLTPTQHTQLQLQQIQQQQQQLQLQTMQLQQQLQQQLQHEQQLHTQNTEQNQSIILPSQVISTPDAPCLTITQSHDFSQGPFTNTLHPTPQVQTVCPSNGSLAGSSQSTTLSTDTFLASETLQILNAGQVQTVAPHVVTLQCSSEPSTTQAVPVSLIQTPVTLSL